MVDPRVAELEARGQSILRDPASFPKAALLENRAVIFQLWHYPSFAAWKSWTVYSRGSAPADVVRRATWKQHTDLEAMNNPLQVAIRLGSTDPTIEIIDAPLDEEKVECWLHELSRIRIPLVQNHSIGCDGESFGIRCGDSFQGMKFNWWSGGPEEWTELIQFCERVRAGCETLFPRN